MAKFFLFLTIVLAGAAAGLGWLTLTKIGEVKKTLKDTQTALTTTKSELEKTKFTLKDTQDQLAAAKTALDTANATIATDKTTIDGLTTQMATVQAQVTDLNAKLDDANKQIATYKALQGGNTGDQGGGSPFEKMITDLKKQITELTQVNQSLQKKADEAEAHAKQLADNELKRVAKLNQPGIEGEVMAVNQGWSFAVISIGDRQGAVPNAEVLVKRGDLLIAKLKITTVEPATSIADIIPETLAKGQRVMPGDRVIFSGQLAQ